MVIAQQHQLAHRRLWRSKAFWAHRKAAIAQKLLRKSHFYFLTTGSGREDTQCISFSWVWGRACKNRQRFPASAPDRSAAKDVTLPNLGNIWEIVFFSPGCAKSNRKRSHWDKSYMMGKWWRKEDVNRVLEEKLFFVSFSVDVAIDF